ncbi:MAG: ribose-5-phosphate isomerase A, partial [Pseudomonadota bacterium]
DNGNWIIDVHGLEIEDAIGTEKALNDVAGVVTNGLFAIAPADQVLVASAKGVRTL